MGARTALPSEALRLDGLWKIFHGGGDVVAVRDVSMLVRQGEFVTLLGPSGSGKTTTLMMVAGFVAPTRGEIYIDGREVTGVPPQKRNLSMVFQNYALFPHMTVGENVAFPLEMRRVARREITPRVERALALVKLPGYERRRPHQLSGGQQQRVALARALVFEPRVLLMDEPLGSLDKKLREHLQLELKHIQQRLGVTVIYVTHDQNEALILSNRIAVMNEGRIEQIGTPAELYEEPANAFVADFIGETNFVEGIVKESSGDGFARIAHASGTLVRARLRTQVACGARVKASVRPERLRLAAPGTGGPTANACRGRVVDIIYVGDFTKFNVAVGEDILSVKVQNGETTWRPGLGDEVDVAWEAVHMKILAGVEEPAP